jgi:hypothetical protein
MITKTAEESKRFVFSFDNKLDKEDKIGSVFLLNVHGDAFFEGNVTFDDRRVEGYITNGVSGEAYRVEVGVLTEQGDRLVVSCVLCIE